MRSRMLWNCVSSFSSMVCYVWSQQVGVCLGRVHITKMLNQYVFPSVRYFDFSETKWRVGDEEILDGRVEVMRSLNLDHLFDELEAYDQGNETLVKPVPSRYYYYEKEWEKTPKYLLVNFDDASYEDAMRNASVAAEKMQADFVVLIFGTTATWAERITFWWSHRFPGSPSASIPPGGNSTHPFFFMAVKRSVGQQIMELMEQDLYLEDLSFGLESNLFEFGVDAAERIKGRELTAHVLMHMLWILMLAKFITNGHRNDGNRNRGNASGRAAYKPAYTGDDLGMGEIQCSSGVQDCPVCLETMQPGETVRVLPCRHILHHDCITGWFQHGKLTCPLCNVDLSTHLKEQRTASLDIVHSSRSQDRWWSWPLRRRIRNMEARDHLIASRHGHVSGRGDENLGDLELTEEAGVFV